MFFSASSSEVEAFLYMTSNVTMKMIPSIFKCIFGLAAMVTLITGGISFPSIQSTDAQRQGLVENRTGSNQNITKTIQISVTEGEVYRWSNIQGTNPTLSFLTNANNTVLIFNPTNEKHEMIIGSKGRELASSGDIVRSSSGQVSFTPNATGAFEYHCEYHPDTMKGTIVATQQ